jgi:hypothetical protein
MPGISIFGISSGLGIWAVSYRPTLIGRALSQFNDLKDDKVIYDALTERILRLVDAPGMPGRSTRAGMSRTSAKPKVSAQVRQPSVIMATGSPSRSM